MTPIRKVIALAAAGVILAVASAQAVTLTPTTPGPFQRWADASLAPTPAGDLPFMVQPRPCHEAADYCLSERREESGPIWVRLQVRPDISRAMFLQGLGAAYQDLSPRRVTEAADEAVGYRMAWGAFAAGYAACALPGSPSPWKPKIQKRFCTSLERTT